MSFIYLKLLNLQQIIINLWNEPVIGRVKYFLLLALFSTPSVLTFQFLITQSYSWYPLIGICCLLLADIGRLFLIRARVRDFGEDDEYWTIFMGSQIILWWLWLLATLNGILSAEETIRYTSLISLIYLFHNLKLVFKKGSFKKASRKGATLREQFRKFYSSIISNVKKILRLSNLSKKGRLILALLIAWFAFGFMRTFDDIYILGMRFDYWDEDEFLYNFLSPIVLSIAVIYTVKWIKKGE